MVKQWSKVLEYLRLRQVSTNDGHGGNFCLRVIRKLLYAFLFDQYTRCILLKLLLRRVFSRCVINIVSTYPCLLYNQRLLSTVNSLSQRISSLILPFYELSLVLLVNLFAWLTLLMRKIFKKIIRLISRIVHKSFDFRESLKRMLWSKVIRRFVC